MNGANRQVRNTVGWLLWRSGLALLARSLLVRGGRFALEFHGIAKRRWPSIRPAAQPHLTVDELREALEWLQDRFAFLTPDEFLDGESVGVLLTFDDGMANNHTNVLPLLAEYEAPAVFFVTTQHILQPENWLAATRRRVRLQWESEESVPGNIAEDLFRGMSEEQLRNCAQNPLITIGSHTVSHPLLTQCQPDQLVAELHESKSCLEEITSQQVDLFAYPAGVYERRVAEAVRAAGYRAAFAEDSLAVGLPQFEIPRIGIYAASPAYLSMKTSGLHRRPVRREFASG